MKALFISSDVPPVEAALPIPEPKYPVYVDPGLDIKKGVPDPECKDQPLAVSDVPTVPVKSSVNKLVPHPLPMEPKNNRTVAHTASSVDFFI